MPRINVLSKKPTAPVTADPYFNDVVLLVHADGANGSTIFTDSSLKARANPSLSGGVALSTAQPGVGTSAIYFDGASTKVSWPLSADFNIGGPAYTVEFRFFELPRPGGNFVFSFGGASQFNPNMLYVANAEGPSSLYFRAQETGSEIVTPAQNPMILNQWNHVAICKENDRCTVFINGVPFSTYIAGTAAAIVNESKSFTLGYGSNVSLRGYIQELRLTKNVVRYRGAFTPPGRLPDHA